MSFWASKCIHMTGVQHTQVLQGLHLGPFKTSPYTLHLFIHLYPL